MEIGEGALVTVTVCEFQNNEAYGGTTSGGGVSARGLICLVCPRSSPYTVS